jgi:hypothetical protein
MRAATMKSARNGKGSGEVHCMTTAGERNNGGDFPCAPA